jgi:Sulfotransferase domain
MPRLIAGLKQVLGLGHPGRNLDVYPDDVFIVSYPKSGNTWTRFLVANLISPNEAADFSNINRLIPDPEAMTKRAMRNAPRPRIIKSHQYFDPRYQKIIYIVRDPRDVAVSQYHFHRKRLLIEDGYSIEKFVTRFVAGETSVYGSWGENAASWLSTRGGKPSFLLLRYEDMLQDTAGELSKIAVFLKQPISQERITQIVQMCSADNMRKLEKDQALLWSSTAETRQDVPFVREAKSGGWKETLSPAAAHQIENAWAPLMNWLGYEVSDPTLRGAEPRLAESILGVPAL